MNKKKLFKFAFLFFSFLLTQNNYAQIEYFTYGIKHNTKVNSNPNHLEPDSSVFSEYNNGTYTPVNFYKNRYDAYKNKIASDAIFGGVNTYDSFVYNENHQLIGQYTYDEYGLLVSLENTFNEDGLLTKAVSFARENNQLIKSYEDSFVYFKQDGKISGVQVYYYIYMQGTIWEQTSFYSFSYGTENYPNSMEYRLYNPNTLNFELHSIYDELKWELNEPCEFFDRQITHFKLYTDSSGFAIYRGYDTCEIINNKIMRRINFRNNQIEGRNSFFYDQNNNLTQQIIEQIRGNDLDTVSIISNYYTYANSGEILEIIRRRQNFPTGTDFRNKTNYYYSVSNLNKDKIKKEISLYPNPSNHYININENYNFDDIKIYSISGQLVCKPKIEGKRIDISNLIPGIYIMEFNNNNEIYYSKLIKN